MIFFTAIFIVLNRDTTSGGETGLAVKYAFALAGTLNWVVRAMSDLETQVVSVERVREYSNVPQEAARFVENKKPAKVGKIS